MTDQDEIKEYKRAVAPTGLETTEDVVIFPEAVLLPVSARGGGTIGMANRPWSLVDYKMFIESLPAFYSLTVHSEPPDMARSSLTKRRTLAEGFLNAVATKTGRRPTMAESLQNTAMDAAESEIALGRPIFRVLFLAALIETRSRLENALNARRTLEAKLRGMRLAPIRLHLIPARSLLTLQPGGNLFPNFLDSPKLFYEEFMGMLPPPSRRVMPARDSVWIGSHAAEGRDVYFSYSAGFDTAAPAPSHSLTLILGEPGSGKTTLLRWIMLQRLLQGRTVLSIDPEGENNTLCQAMGGKVIPARLPEDPEVCLLHPLEAETPQDMLLAARFLIASLLGVEGVTPGIQAVLHEAVKKRWERAPGRMSLADLVDAMGTLNDSNAQVPISLLRPYMRGGLWDGFFDRPKALLSRELLTGQWLNFDLSTLTDENKGIIHSVLSWFIYQVVTVGKTPMDIYIDEGWRLLRSGPFADLLDELGRRARKRDIGITLITHMAKDLLKNPTSMNMASTAFLGTLSPDEAFVFFRSLGIAEAEASQSAEQVSKLQRGTFMAAPSGGRGALFPVRVKIPSEWLRFIDQINSARES